MARSKTSKTRGASKTRRGGGYVVVYIAFGLLLVFAPALAALLLVGMMPTLVSLFADMGAYKGPRLVTMFSFNAAGVLPYAKALVEEGLHMAGFNAVMTDVVSWTVMYGAAGAGAAVIWLGPVLAAAAQQILNADAVSNLDRRRTALIAEWGEELAQSMDD